jgi:hypothetical protein
MFYLFEFCLKNMWNCSLTQQKRRDIKEKRGQNLNTGPKTISGRLLKA